MLTTRRDSCGLCKNSTLMYTSRPHTPSAISGNIVAHFLNPGLQSKDIFCNCRCFVTEKFVCSKFLLNMKNRDILVRNVNVNMGGGTDLSATYWGKVYG